MDERTKLYSNLQSLSPRKAGRNNWGNFYRVTWKRKLGSWRAGVMFVNQVWGSQQVSTYLDNLVGTQSFVTGRTTSPLYQN